MHDGYKWDNLALEGLNTFTLFACALVGWSQGGFLGLSSEWLLNKIYPRAWFWEGFSQYISMSLQVGQRVYVRTEWVVKWDNLAQEGCVLWLTYTPIHYCGELKLRKRVCFSLEHCLAMFNSTKWRNRDNCLMLLIKVWRLASLQSRGKNRLQLWFIWLL